MKVLALNSSARTGDVSKTEIVLDYLVRGMREAGAEVDVIELRRKKIRYCIGCFTCWTKTPGTCVHKDDMTKEIFPKYLACDLVVLATPLYHFTVNALMKTFIERTLPIALPFFEKRDGVTSHPLRHEPPPAVVVSVAGFPEESVFDQLKSYVNYLYGPRLVAEIYRPSSEILTPSAGGGVLAEIYGALMQGGRELVQSLKISPETMDRIKKPLSDFEKTASVGNLMWRTCINEGFTLGEAQKRGLIPRPDSIETFLEVMRFGFHAKKAGDARVAMQFRFTGQVQGECYLAIEDGTLETGLGKIGSPDLTIESPFEVWMDILTRKADGQQAFLDKKYSVSGDISILMRMNEFFGR
ncbi:MAG: NAD(P)H-dependent oxidoreductase [Deltaproteobacteria bacterium]|nr:NAD(P)H-dependent oxidoreductase [Deltaproteobacteria bacterium]